MSNIVRECYICLFLENMMYKLWQFPQTGYKKGLKLKSLKINKNIKAVKDALPLDKIRLIK